MADQINDVAGKWLEKTVWIWLPFVACKKLIEEVIEKHSDQ